MSRLRMHLGSFPGAHNSKIRSPATIDNSTQVQSTQTPMFLIKRPTEKRIADFLQSTETLPLSYTEAGMTAVQPPAGYRADHNRVILGKGPETFERAATSLKHWKHFDLGWVKLFPRDGPVAVGSTVTVLVNHLFLWSLNSCQIWLCLRNHHPACGKRRRTIYNRMERLRRYGLL